MIPLMLPKRSSRCTKCEHPFSGGDELLTTLDDDLNRQDLCAECSSKADGSSQWRSIYPSKEKQQRSLTGTERFLQGLKRAIEGGDGQRSYFLALYLQRRGLLNKVKTLKRKAGSVALFEVKTSGECLQVPIVEGEMDKEAILEQLDQ